MTEKEKEELLNKARNDYVVGTDMRCLKDSCRGISIIEPIFCPTEAGSIVTKYGGYSHWQFIYKNSRWAEIVSFPKPTSLLESFIIF